MSNTKNYSYKLIGSSVIENNTGINTIKELKAHVGERFGKAQFEYWSQSGIHAGEAWGVE